MFRMIAAIRDVLILLAVTAGPPVALTAVAGSPIPAHRPSTAVVQSFLDDPLQPAFAPATARTTAWLLWAGYTTVILIVLALRLRRLPGRLRRMTAYLPPPMQGLTATILGAAAITSTAAPAAAAAAPPVSVTGTTAPTIGHITADPAPPTAGIHTSAQHTTSVPGAVTGGNEQHLPTGTSPPAAPHRATCTVRPGDTLFGIAAQHLGDGDRWPEIFALNKGTRFHRTGGTLTDPDLIYPGWTLRLPATTTAPPPAAPPAGSHARTPGHATPSTNSVAPTTRPAGAGAPSRSQQAPSTTAAARPTTPSTHAPGAATAEHGGIDLRDHGWVAADVAAAVSAAVTLLWIHRRRRYRTQQPTNRRPDTDLTPLPTTVAALHHAHTPAEDTTMDPLAPDLPEAGTVTAAALGAHPQHGPLRIEDLPAQGVGLTGPGAPAAARGMLAAVLTAGGPWASDTEATIITTRPDLHLLLDTADVPALDRLIVVDDALDEAEHQLLHRARTAADNDITEPTGTPAMPHTVILTAAPTSSRGHRLAAILTIGSRLGITAILTGDWTHGETWTVTPTGTTTATDSADGPRLNTLDATATLDVLATLNEARPSTSESPVAGSLHLAAGPPPPTATQHPPSATPAEQIAPDSPDRPSADQPPTNNPAISVTVLGRPHVRIAAADGETELRIRRTDGIQILVHLAVERDGATSDQLMAALWPEIRPRYARGRFHTTMSELRGLLSDAGHNDTIQRTGERYHLNAQRVHVDLWDLNTAIERASVALDPTAHLTDLRTVISLYTGTIADGYTWLWLAPYREATRRHLLDAHIALADAENDPKTALAHVQNAITLDPYNEDVYQHAMRLHAKLGSTDGIRRTLRALSERLTELEIRISPQTRQIATDLITRIDARHRVAA